MLSLELPTWSDRGSNLKASVSPNGASAYYAGTGAGAVVTGKVACAASGGTPPYTYAWVRVGGDVQINATSPSNVETSFFASPPPSTFSYVALFNCQVTDAVATVALSNTITVEIDRNT